MPNSEPLFVAILSRPSIAPPTMPRSTNTSVDTIASRSVVLPVTLRVTLPVVASYAAFVSTIAALLLRCVTSVVS